MIEFGVWFYLDDLIRMLFHVLSLSNKDTPLGDYKAIWSSHLALIIICQALMPVIGYILYSLIANPESTSPYSMWEMSSEAQLQIFATPFFSGYNTIWNIWGKWLFHSILHWSDRTVLKLCQTQLDNIFGWQ